MIRWAAGIVLALAACPPVAAQTALPTTVSPSDPIEVLANFFVPAAPIETATGNICEGRTRVKLTADPGMTEIERQLPGLIDRQVAATAAYCRREFRGWLTRSQDRVRADWRGSTSPADLARLAKMMAVATNEALVTGGQPREPTAAENARLLAAQTALARTPGGIALVNRVADYQRKLAAENEDPSGTGFREMMGIVRAAMAAGRKAANDYAREKGKPPIYDEAPAG